MSSPIRIFLHDYGRYAFTLELAKELARRGHTVRYAYSDIDSVRSSLDRDGIETLDFCPIRGGDRLSKTSFVKRFQTEINHGTLAARAIRDFKPNVVLSGNAPLEAQWRMQKASEAISAGFVYWMQDVLSLAARKILGPKLGPVGSLVSDHFERIEKAMLRRSDRVVVIAPLFAETLTKWNVDQRNVHLIENWAPLLPVPDAGDIAAWARRNNIDSRKAVVYSGTLGMKHKPELVLELAEAWKAKPDRQIVVIAEGAGMEWLRSQTSENPRGNLKLMGFVEFAELPLALGSASVLLVLLEQDAAGFCVPSKTLTYMTAGRPILAAMSPMNLVAQIIRTRAMGYVGDPSNTKEFLDCADRIMAESPEAAVMGSNARSYAEQTFNLKSIGDNFESVLESALAAK